MNDKQLEFFRQKLTNWKLDLLDEAIDTKDNLSFNIYSTKKAKENYDPDTGSIGACEQNEKCNGKREKIK